MGDVMLLSDAARLLGVTPSALWKAKWRGKLKYLCVRPHLAIVTRAELEAYVAQCHRRPGRRKRPRLVLAPE